MPTPPGCIRSPLRMRSSLSCRRDDPHMARAEWPPAPCDTDTCVTVRPGISEAAENMSALTRVHALLTHAMEWTVCTPPPQHKGQQKHVTLRPFASLFNAPLDERCMRDYEKQEATILLL
ncbi:hypothetical protein NDU88_006904 [Pleurodeles waltl]|uniref:Uncharacterized protein n=1 Tax=Pleurodeles waltl TaxID=8319 RepID=A0AAV7TYC8_PLEWA|nr:hypothetical protein NDU88_006904 [Pleurodeles waltl]